MSDQCSMISDVGGWAFIAKLEFCRPEYEILEVLVYLQAKYQLDNCV